MDWYLMSVNYHIFYQWLKFNKWIKFDEKISINMRLLNRCDKGYNLRILFYDNYIIEECLTDMNGNTLYYIHFEFLNYMQGVRLVNNCIHYFKMIKLSPKNILICCSSGFSSTLFAESLQKISDEMNLNIKIKAKAIDLVTKQEEYDVILLTPQIEHYKPILLKRKNAKIISVPIQDYACRNYNNILSIIDNV